MIMIFVLKKWQMDTKKKPRHRLYDDAYTMFVEYGMTAAAIAESTGLTEATLSKWRNSMGWDRDREETLARPDKIREVLMKELKSIAEGEKPKIDTDALSKISKTLQYFDGRLSLPILVSALKECDNFILKYYPDKAVEIVGFHKEFLIDRAKQDSLK
jgi:hypothetical protein